MQTPEDEVREASARFYSALNRMANGDADPLAEVWHHGAEATTMHPVGGREAGWGPVQASFAQVAHLASEGQIRLEEQLVRVVGDLAYELGVERGAVKLGGLQSTVDSRVTNIYRKDEGTWRIVHHHTDVSPSMVEILDRLSAKA
ncbi:nuclear transport factor 2 family protein [Geothrix sp. 21YS21S-2]|uniref:YybH family protein n=1 Tax=Geothrix sp. 21YS21S-2 TaxID=3068893 RepID=UPI0027BAA228|nr:nuclear transport factor 2 family protein [Geothrix sp. 21YS21S-2]